MTTRSAEANGSRCPLCRQLVKQDKARRGFSVHRARPAREYAGADGLCRFERGKKAL
jgi:hypothetical protein